MCLIDICWINRWIHSNELILGLGKRVVRAPINQHWYIGSYKGLGKYVLGLEVEFTWLGSWWFCGHRFSAWLSASSLFLECLKKLCLMAVSVTLCGNVLPVSLVGSFCLKQSWLPWSSGCSRNGGRLGPGRMWPLWTRLLWVLLLCLWFCGLHGFISGHAWDSQINKMNF